MRRLPAFARAAGVALALVAAAAACGSTADDGTTDPDTSQPATSAPETTVTTAATTSTSAPPSMGSPPPEWLGTRVLPLRSDGIGEVQPTPPELVDRRLWTTDVLPPPDGEAFESAIVEVPAEVVARSTWQEACPVGLDGLRYVTVSFYGFDGRFHTGELLVATDVAEGIVEVFRRLHAARFPMEEVRITRPDELDAPPTGDGNNTGAFVCRPVTGGSGWSEHAYGRAIDINPFHNPYERGDVVLPELASAYLDRSNQRPGMILPGDAATQAFAELGWGWGGEWNSLKDYQHFSENDR